MHFLSSVLIAHQHSCDKTLPRREQAIWHLDPAQEKLCLARVSKAPALGESNGPTTLYPAVFGKQILFCVPQGHSHKGTERLSPPNSNHTAISRSLFSFKSSTAADEGKEGGKKRRDT